MKRIQPASSTSFNRPKQSNTRNIKKLFLVSMPKLKLSALFMCTIIRARLLVYDIISDEYNKWWMFGQIQLDLDIIYIYIHIHIIYIKVLATPQFPSASRSSPAAWLHPHRVISGLPKSRKTSRPCFKHFTIYSESTLLILLALLILVILLTIDTIDTIGPYEQRSKPRYSFILVGWDRFAWSGVIVIRNKPCRTLYI